jgi:hypothetical protein
MKKFNGVAYVMKNEMERQKKVFEAIQDDFIPIIKKMELRHRLKRYNAKFIKGKLISITLENIESLKKYDPETLELIISLKYSFQIKVKL